MEKIKLNINGRELTGNPGQTILETARENNIYIPTLCYSEHFEPYASCGICLVEIEGVPRPLRACATAISNGMIIKTESQKIKKARKLALELILSDHRGDCRGPCVMACPANCDAQGYVALAANGMFREALKLVKEFMPIPGSIGRVCPAPCEKDCRRSLLEGAISIRYIKRLLADIDMESGNPYLPEVAADTGKKIAVVGSGPAGLTAAYFLRRKGHCVTVFEALPQTGGMLRYGIPEYRLPKRVLDWEISLVERLGVEFRTNMRLGEDFTINHLKKIGFDAVYVATGAQSSKKMGIVGEDLPGVIGGADFLRSMFLNGSTSIGKRVAVVGGGNVAMDAVRTSKRLGAKGALIIYRRGWDEMPAQAIEVHEAKEEGIEFHLLTAPVRIEGNGKVEKIVCQKMELGKPDASGRRKPQPIADAFVEFEVDTIIAAIGQDVETEDLREEIEFNKYNTISIEQKTFATSMPGVFAGGDAVTGPDDAIVAIAAGKRAAFVIDQYINGKSLELPGNFNSKIENMTASSLSDIPSVPKATMPLLSPEVRIKSFSEVESGITPQDAIKDGLRCLECGCFDAFECKLRRFSDDYGAKASRIKGQMHEYKKAIHPFIVREQDKCILCGLCVKMCANVVGAEALGLVNRGFETYVGPSLDSLLAETTCISCGQCVSICPTGALSENLPVDKPAAWELESVSSTCGFCGVGCSIKIETKGDKVFRVVPGEENGLLCHRGRFGFTHVNDPDRIALPMIRTDGVLKPVDLKTAMNSVSSKVKSIRALHGSDSIAVLAGARYTNEELYMIQKFARTALLTNNIASIAEHDHPLSDVTGFDVSTNSYEEVESSDMILAAGIDVKDYPVMAMKLRKASTLGTKLFLVDNRDSLLTKDCHRFIYISENSTSGVFAAILAYITKNKCVNKAFVDKYTEGYSKLESWAFSQDIESLLENSGLTENDIAQIAESFVKAKNPLIVAGAKRLSGESTRILAAIAAITGKIGLPRRGIILMKERCNSQGLSDMGISSVNLPGYQKVEDADCSKKFSSEWNVRLNPKPGLDYDGIIDGLNKGTIKAVFVFGENPDKDTLAILRKAEFLAVHEQLPTELTELADCVLPAASFSESEGSFTDSGRKIKKLNCANPPKSGFSNTDVIHALMEALNYSYKRATIKEIRREIARLVPQYGNITRLESQDSICWNDSPCSDIEKIVSEKGRLKLFVPDTKKSAMRERVYKDSMLSRYYGNLSEKGLQL
jgi:formate dehydrogenase major subunit